MSEGQSTKIIASFGGGVNSTAMLIGCHERGELVDMVLFADTGGEKPETYEHVCAFSRWLSDHGMPPIITVREERFTLEEECRAAKTLPSIVIGIRSCSDKFKIRPQERYLKSLGITDYTKLIGFDASEPHRIKVDRPNNRYPLIEWGWAREECIAAIRRAGTEVPPKSSCFFCPEMREREIIALEKAHPDLVARAIAMERNNSSLVTIKGLARSHSWEQVIEFHRNQLMLDGTTLLPERADGMPCGCVDGE